MVGGAFFRMHDRTTTGYNSMHRPARPFRHRAVTQHVKVRDVNHACKGAVLTWSSTASYDPVGWQVGVGCGARACCVPFGFRLVLACCRVAGTFRCWCWQADRQGLSAPDGGPWPADPRGSFRLGSESRGRRGVTVR